MVGLTISLVAGGAVAEPSAPRADAAVVRVAVRIAADGDGALLTRARGQTSDLPIVLVPVRAPGIEGSLREQINSADAIAVSGAFTAVVWFASSSTASRTQLVVHVSHPRTRDLLTRTIAWSGEPDAASRTVALSSAALESAALVVRTALRTLLETGSLPPDADASVTPTPPQKPAPSLVAAASDSPARAEPRPSRGSVALSAFLAMDGLTPWGEPGLSAAAGLGWERVRGEVALSSTLPTSVTDEYASVALARAMLTAGAFARLKAGARVVFSAGARAGAAVIFRNTTPRLSSVSATPATRTLSPVVAPELAASWSSSSAGGLAFLLALAADYLPRAPALVYEREGQQSDARYPFTLQPRLSLGVLFGGP